jgi:SAM-dependent methyltransferase
VQPKEKRFTHLSKDAWLDWYPNKKVEETVVNLAKILKENKASRILDFGCGTGRNTVYLAQQGFNMYGFDWSDTAVMATKQELSKHGLNADLQVWDMNNTPFPYNDAFFDGVLAMRVLHHSYLDNIHTMAVEIERIMKQDGVLYVEVPTYEKALRQEGEGMRFEKPEAGTFVHLEGDEEGIPHHHFKKHELLELFPEFIVKTLDVKNEHYCLTGLRK